MEASDSEEDVVWSAYLQREVEKEQNLMENIKNKIMKEVREDMTQICHEKVERISNNLKQNFMHLKEDMREEIQEMKEELQKQIREEMKKELQAQIREEMKQEMQAQIREEMKQEMQDEIKKNYDGWMEDANVAQKELCLKLLTAATEALGLPDATTQEEASPGKSLPIKRSKDAEEGSSSEDEAPPSKIVLRRRKSNSPLKNTHPKLVQRVLSMVMKNNCSTAKDVIENILDELRVDQHFINFLNDQKSKEIAEERVINLYRNLCKKARKMILEKKLGK